MAATSTGRTTGQKAGVRRFIYKTGLCEGTNIATREGNLPVEYLTTDDWVKTPSGIHRIRHISTRPLTDCPIEVRRDALGPGRPAHDLYLAPDQPVRLSDWRSHKLFGADRPAVPVSRLEDGQNIQWGEHPGELLVYDLELESEQVIYAEGMQVMSATLPLPVAANVAANVAAE
jgi:hypothetical protein